MSLIPKTFAGKEMQRICHTIFFSLTTDMNPIFQNPRVPAARPGIYKVPGVRVHFFLAAKLCQSPIVSKSMAALVEDEHWQMWEFIRI